MQWSDNGVKWRVLHISKYLQCQLYHYLSSYSYHHVSFNAMWEMYIKQLTILYIPVEYD